MTQEELEKEGYNFWQHKVGDVDVFDVVLQYEGTEESIVSVYSMENAISAARNHYECHFGG